MRSSVRAASWWMVAAACAGVAWGAVAPIESQIELAHAANDAHAEIELLRRWIDQKPEDASARQKLVLLWEAVGDYDMAESALSEWPAPPEGLAAKIRAGALAKRDGKIEDAIVVLRRYLATAARDPNALQQLAEYLGETGMWNEQAAVLDRLNAVKPTSARYLMRAAAARRLGDYSGAVKAASNAHWMEPDGSGVKSALPSYERLEQMLPIIEETSARLEKNPENPELLLRRASCLQYGGADDMALKDAGAAAKIARHSALARIIKARALVALGETTASEASDELQIDVRKPVDNPETSDLLIKRDIAVEAAPQDPAAYSDRANVLNAKSGQYLLALEDAKAALALNPAGTGAALDALYASVKLGRSDDSIAWFRSIELSRPSPHLMLQALGSMAELHFAAQNAPEALAFVDRALRIEVNEQLLRLQSACLQRMGRTSEAAEAFRRADKLKKKTAK